MRVLICPDKFAGSLSAPQVADALARGWTRACPTDEVHVLPLSDGGPGFVSILRSAVAGEVIEVPTCDPLGRPAVGRILLAGRTAYLESADACGLHLLAQTERDPKQTTSYGLGLLIVAAVEHGAAEIVVGLGGSATNDGGAGMLAAMGTTPVDIAGRSVPYGGAPLIDCAAVRGWPRLRSARLVAAYDVDSPLVGPHGASAVFGPQKGASEADVALLDQALARFAGVLTRDLDTCPDGLAELPGSGAAGGIAAALLALGATAEPGVALVARVAGLARALDGASVVLTGEGSLDAASLSGKVVSGVAAAARERAVTCVVVAGRVLLDPTTAGEAGIDATYSLVDHFGDERSALTRTEEGLTAIAAQIARRVHANPP